MIKKIILPLTLTALGILGAACIRKKHKTPPVLGDVAPAFIANSTQGIVNFPEDFNGHWTILFSHPGDFTLVCTTEYMIFQSMLYEFSRLNTKIVGISVDCLNTHFEWLKEIKEKINYNGLENIDVTFPVIEDKDSKIANLYGMISPSSKNKKSVRALYIIDPKGVIRAILMYPKTNGRNIKEVKRLLIALQTSDMFDVATPADWEPGDDTIIPPPETWEETFARLEQDTQEIKCHDWYFCFRPLPVDEIRQKLFTN